MDQDASSVSSSQSDNKKHKHKNGSTKKRSRNNGSGSLVNGERRASISKPARDLRDEPETKRQRKERYRREQALARREKHDAAADGAATPTTRGNSPVIDFDGLSRPSFGTRERLEESAEKHTERLERMKGAVKTLLECVGEDPNREGLLATPERYAKAMLFFTQGYQQNMRDIVNGAIFQEHHNEMVIVKDIEVFSRTPHAHTYIYIHRRNANCFSLRTPPCAVHRQDAHWLHPQQCRDWYFEATSYRRNVCTPHANPRKAHS